MHRSRSLILPSLLLVAAGCGGGGAADVTLSLELNGLPTLGADQVYEGWLIVDGSPVSTGRFNVDSTSAFVDMTVDSVTAGEASTFVLTIDPAVGDDPAPADTHVLAGDFDADNAELTIDHPAALATDFADAEGEFDAAERHRQRRGVVELGQV